LDIQTNQNRIRMIKRQPGRRLHIFQIKTSNNLKNQIMSIIRINDGLDISITHDAELEEAMQLFFDNLNSVDLDEEVYKETERKLHALKDAMNLYDGNYRIIDYY
jgi:hypothetical protein